MSEHVSESDTTCIIWSAPSIPKRAESRISTGVAKLVLDRAKVSCIRCAGESEAETREIALRRRERERLFERERLDLEAPDNSIEGLCCRLCRPSSAGIMPGEAKQSRAVSWLTSRLLTELSVPESDKKEKSGEGTTLTAFREILGVT